METFPAPARARFGGSRVPTLRFKTRAKSGIFPRLIFVTAFHFYGGDNTVW